MSTPSPDEKRGGYSGSKAEGEIVAPTSKGATETPQAAQESPVPASTEKSAAA